ncbi:radial spoke head 1 homolog [Malaya genurostris]|uniref:radial spoke head 1 homolog n=1 Tax=Malaya genurostris TaxID=325434 RepID=UPI0026F39F15|nr:radial spoke head 1 homolog [Malaya genurostris]
MTHTLGREKICSEFRPSEEENREFEIQKYNGPRNSRDEPHGEGKAKLVNGNRYEGSFRRGLPHGKGRLFLRDGYNYAGRWRKGLKHGMGRMNYPDCTWYEGEFRKDRRHGSGTYYYSNGARYQGNWLADERHGVGRYFFSDGDIILNGTWLEGMARGPAEIIMEGCRFHGYWDGDFPRGPGYFSFGAKVMVKGKFYVDEREASETKPVFWRPEAFENYEYSKLPLEPLPLPVDESEISETSSSEDEECLSGNPSIVLSE